MKRNLLLALVFVATSAVAQFTNDPALNSIVRDSSGPEEVVPICALNPQYGTTYVSWFNQNGMGSYDFSMQALDNFGYHAFQPSSLTVSNFPQSTAIFVYDTKVDNTNSMVSGFQDERSGVLDVVAYRVDQSGNFQWGSSGISLKDSAASGGIAPNVGILPSNDAVIAWIADGSPKDWISIRKISPAGNFLWASPTRIIDSTGVASFSRPQIVPMLNDDFMILYVRQTGSGLPASAMYMQRYDASGNPVWASPVAVSSKLIGFAAYPSVVPDGNNGAYIAYSSGNPSNPSMNDVYVQHIDGNGNLWSVDGTEACTSTLTHRMSPKIRFENGMANPMVLIKETDAAQGSSGVTIQSFDASGNRLLGPDGFAVTPITALYDEPYDMRAETDGMIILYAEGTFGNQQLLATKVNFTGTSVWTPATTVVSSVVSNKSRAQLTPVFSIIDLSNQIVAVWEDDRQDVGVYAQNINYDGTLGIQVNISSPDRQQLNAVVFPNPSGSNSFLKINSTTLDEVTATMYDATGRVIGAPAFLSLTSGTNEFKVNEIFRHSNLASGIYSIDIKGEKTAGRVQMVVE